MRTKTFKLKQKSGDGYPGHTCAASRCQEPSSVIYHTESGPWPKESVPLCDSHWERFTEMSGDANADVDG